jgi:hypothetical protein
MHESYRDGVIRAGKARAARHGTASAMARFT